MSTEQPFTPGASIDMQGDTLVVSSYAAYAAMAEAVDVFTPATPIVYVELGGFTPGELPAPAKRAPSKRICLVFEVAGASGLVEGVINSLRMLENIARNQERPR